ncbi:thioesterase family protein [Candidatus Poseidonia alphae]|nr:thioesterase family protein [Candidatus Poseidonia alphae]
MAVVIERSVEFPMVDLANIAYFPRIYDLAHRVFEATWPEMCGVDYPTVLGELKVGFPVINIASEFKAPMRYGDRISAHISISHIGSTSLVWEYRFINQHADLVWSSSQTTVCVDMDTLKPTPIPERLKTGLLNHLDGGVDNE